MRRFGSFFAAIAVLSTVSPRSEAADDKTSEAIDRGIEYLLPATEARLKSLEGRFGQGAPTPTQENEVGPLALQIYSLVVAGVSVENPTVSRAFDFLSRMPFAHTYSVALYIFALDAAIAQMEEDVLLLQPRKIQAQFRDDASIGKEYRPRLQAAVESFIRSQNAKGVWRYGPGAQDFDNSNVQFAVLALGVGAKRGVPMQPETWVKVVDHFVKGQQKEGPEIADRLTLRPTTERGTKRDDVHIVKKENPKATKTSKKKAGDKEGRTKVITAPRSDEPEIGTEGLQVFQRGWDYENKGQATWNMTCAGLSSLILSRENLRGKILGDAKAALDKSIWDGYGWVMGHWSPNDNYYGMYSLEKVGDLGEVQKFGQHDWYEEMKTNLLGRQQADGGWPTGAWATDSPVATAYALLILNRATSLLTMDRGSKIVVSGRKGSGEGAEDRNWVYIRELDTSMHAPSLLRAIRLRPSAKLLRFLDSVLESYPDNYRGELVPELVSIRDVLPSKATQKVIDDYLAKITGAKYDTAEQYMSWTTRWRRVMQMGETPKPEYKDALLQYYKLTTKSLPLKRTIMWALFQCKVRESVPVFIEDLSDADPQLRLEAYRRIKDFFIDSPPAFDAAGTPQVRETQVAAIKSWYAKQTP